MSAILPLLCALALPVQARTPEIASWEKLKYGMFIHYGMSTFDGKEINEGNSDPSVYAPTNLDVRQWVHVAKEAGMRYAILTAKHTAGFCNWPSGDYDITLSPNKTDVVGEFMKACKDEGIQPGLYYCILDGHNEGGIKWEAPVTASYFELIKKHLTQLHTQYPGIGEQWLDIPAKLSQDQRQELYDLIKRLSPKCLVLMNRSDWIRPGMQVMNGAWPTDLMVGERNPPPTRHDPRKIVDGSTYYLPLECCDTLTDNWFWTDGDKPRPLNRLYRMYDNVTSRGANFLLDVAPDKTGRIPQESVARLMELKNAIEQPETVEKPVSAMCTGRASSVFKDQLDHAATYAFDENYETRWAANDDDKQAWLEVDLGHARLIDHFSLSELYPGRIQEFEIQRKFHRDWITMYKGTDVGAELVGLFAQVRARNVRLKILKSHIGAWISEFQLYSPRR